MNFFNQYSALLGNQELLKKRVQNWKRLHLYTWILVSRIKFPFADFYKHLLIGSLNHNEITQFTSTEFLQSYHRISTIMYIDQSLYDSLFTLIHYHLGRKYLFVKTCTFCMRRCLFIVMVVLSFCRSFLPTWKWVRLIWTE